jgi:tetratricopeptide (TPR) repeat protein
MNTAGGIAEAAQAFERAGSLQERGDLGAAIQAYRQCLGIAPNSFTAHYNLGNALISAGRLPEAVEAFVACLRVAPEFGAAYVNLANALQILGLLEQAQPMAELGVHHLPNEPVAKVCLANILHDRSEYEMAETLYRQVLAVVPDHSGALANLGNTLHAMGRVGESIVLLDRATAAAPDEPEFHFNLAAALLTAGDYDRGWREYEWRWRRAQAKPRDFGQAWGGEGLAGRTILLHAEQGLGDTLQFARYAPLVAERGGRVILEVQSPLVRLMRTLPGIAKVIARGDGLPRFDTHCPLMSLPRVFATRVDTIPATAYLSAYPADLAAWRTRLPATDSRLRVGLVWAGSAHMDDPGAHVIDGRRSLKATDLGPLLALSDVLFVSLQKHDRPVEDGRPVDDRLLDAMSDVTDFADTAALIANLDLVISVDTSVAHLAGALGKPVWLLSRFDGCWRWLQGRDDTPWYPSMRLYRQRHPHDWSAVLERVRSDLISHARRMRDRLSSV